MTRSSTPRSSTRAHDRRPGGSLGAIEDRRPSGVGDQRSAGSAGRGPGPASSFGSPGDEDQAGHRAGIPADAGGARVVDEDVLDAEVVDDEAGVADAGSSGPDGPEGPAGRDSGSGDPALEAVIQQRDEYLSALMRLQADFENYKKRIIKQQTEHLERAAEGLVEKLLPVLDTADLALAHGGGEDIKQIMSALTSALDREGLERIDPAGWTVRSHPARRRRPRTR